MEKSTQAGPRRVLSLFDAICIIVGTIIGAGIFKAAPLIAKSTNGFAELIGLWIFGGLITIAGALCFAELTTRFPNLLGGDYGFLKLAFGKTVGFLFAWATFWIIRPGNMGAMAITFAIYFSQMLYGKEGGGNSSIEWFAVAAVVALSLINLVGLKKGTWIQNILTLTKILGLVLIFILGCVAPVGQQEIWQTDVAGAKANWLLAMVFIMFSFGGWNDLSFVAAEIKQPQKNLFRALVFGTLTVTSLYLLANVAFALALGFEGMVETETVATDVVRHAFGAESSLGQRGAQIVAALICISCLGAINGIIITSPRIYHAAGRDYRMLRMLGHWSESSGQPWIATALQAVVTIGLFCLCFQFDDPFEVIIVVSAPFFWTFLGLVGIALIVLRIRIKDATGFRTPLYPLEPLILTVSCFAMAYASAKHVFDEGYFTAAGIVTGLMVLGLLFGLTLRPEIQNEGESDAINSHKS